MKKMFKWAGLSLISGAMLMLAACGGGTAAEPETAQPAQPPTQQETTGETTTPPATEDPAERERTTLTVLTWDRGGPGAVDAADNYFTRWIQEQVLEELNIEVEFVAIGRWSEGDDIVNLMAAGMAPDLAMTWNGGMVQTFGRQGGIMNLGPLLEENLANLPDLEEWLDDMLWVNQDPLDGSIFSIMQRRAHVPRTGTFIRADWLDTLGIPVPTTHEEFLDALRAFRDNADVLGVSTMVPLAMTNDVRWRASTLLESFIDPNLSQEELFIHFVGDRHILLPGYVDGVRMLNQMFHEGLIDPDFAFHDGDEFSDNMVVAGQVGAYIHNWDNLWRANPDIKNRLLELDPDARFIPIDPFPNPVSGLTQKITYEVHGFHIFIPTTSQNPVGALEYLNWMSRVENRLFLQVGEEGYHHDIAMVGGYEVPIMIEFDTEGPRRMYSPQNIDLTLVVNGIDLGSQDANAASMSLAFPGIDPQLVADSYNIALYHGFQMPVVTVPGGLPHNDQFAPTFQELVSQLLAQAIVADPADFDAVWEAGMQGMLNAGAQQAMDERRAGLSAVE